MQSAPIAFCRGPIARLTRLCNGTATGSSSADPFVKLTAGVALLSCACQANLTGCVATLRRRQTNALLRRRKPEPSDCVCVRSLQA